MTVSAIRPVDIQSHLYSSFLHGHTADIVLRISGRWKALYRLHRVVLIQAVSAALPLRRLHSQPLQDFFRSLFTAGFRESGSPSRSRHQGVEEIDIVFDDSNITRAGAGYSCCLDVQNEVLTCHSSF